MHASSGLRICVRGGREGGGLSLTQFAAVYPDSQLTRGWFALVDKTAYHVVLDDGVVFVDAG